MAGGEDRVGRLRAQARLEAFFGANRCARPEGDQVFVHGGCDAGPGYHDDLICLGRENGETRWSFGSRDHPFDLQSPFVLAGGQVLVGRNNGRFYALDARDGSPRWTYHHDTAMAMGARLDDVVLVADAEGWLRRLDPATGRALSERRGGRGFAFPDSTHGLILSHLEGAVTRLDPASLAEGWRRTFDAPLCFPVLPSPPCLAACFVDGRLLGLDADTGATVWQGRIRDGSFLPPATMEGDLFTLTSGGGLSVFECATGRLRYHLRVPGATSLTVGDGLVFVDGRAGITVIDGHGGHPVGVLPVAGSPQPRLAAASPRLFALRVRDHARLLVCLERSGAPVWTAEIGTWGLT